MEASDIKKLKDTLAALCDYVAGIRVGSFDEPYRDNLVKLGKGAIELLSKTPENDNSARDNVTAGNMAECRSALEAIADSARTGSISTLPSAKLILKTCEKALAAPPRNCDVGTAEEQYKRFSKFCANHRCDLSCPACPAGTFYHTECVTKWERMPFESEAAK